MLSKILIAVVVIVAVFVVVVAMQPSEFASARQVTIAAPAPVVFEQVNDLHEVERVVPVRQDGSGHEETYAELPPGPAPATRGSGNSRAGEGRDDRRKPSERADQDQLDFTSSPSRAPPSREFTFKPQGDSTTVEWSLTGTNNFVSKAVHLFMNMDKMVGAQFEEASHKLKSTAEAAPKLERRDSCYLCLHPLPSTRRPHESQPYLFFDGRCEEAVEFYRKGARRGNRNADALQRRPEPHPPGMIPPGAEQKIMHYVRCASGKRR